MTFGQRQDTLAFELVPKQRLLGRKLVRFWKRDHERLGGDRLDMQTLRFAAGRKNPEIDFPSLYRIEQMIRHIFHDLHRHLGKPGAAFREKRLDNERRNRWNDSHPHGSTRVAMIVVQGTASVAELV